MWGARGRISAPPPPAPSRYAPGGDVGRVDVQAADRRHAEGPPRMAGQVDDLVLGQAQDAASVGRRMGWRRSARKRLNCLGSRQTPCPRLPRIGRSPARAARSPGTARSARNA
jgi:hypothetical protein